MSAHRLTIIALFCLFCLWSRAGDNPYGSGARFGAMANASVALWDIWSGNHNQAGLAKIDHLSASIFYEDRYSIKEMGVKALAIVLPTKSGNFSVNYSQYGFRLYNSSKMGLAYALQLGKHLWAGVQIDYFQLHFQQIHGNHNTFTFETGILAEPLPDFFVGFHIFNPIQETIHTLEGNEKLPTMARIGWAWILSPEFLLSMETEKDLHNLLRTRVGLEYQIAKQITLRAGAATNPEILTAGIGFHLKHINTDIAFSRHPVLGYSPALSFNLIF